MLDMDLLFQLVFHLFFFFFNMFLDQHIKNQALSSLSTDPEWLLLNGLWSELRADPLRSTMSRWQQAGLNPERIPLLCAKSLQTVYKDYWEYKNQVKDTFTPPQPAGRWEWKSKALRSQEELNEFQGILKQTVHLCMSVWEDQAIMWTFAATVHCLLAAALLSASCLQLLMATEDDVTPRISFPYSKSKWLPVHTLLFSCDNCEHTWNLVFWQFFKKTDHSSTFPKSKNKF